MRSPPVVAMLLAVLWASLAHAVDGVIELNDARALAGGVTAGDAPGYPVAISQPGSYRLTGALTMPDANTDAIVVDAGSVQIDLNGFTIRGPNTWTGGATNCTAPGSGRGIFADATRSGIVVSNGSVVGSGAGGISLLGPNGRVERVIVEQSCADGIHVGDGSLVINSIARLNYDNGVRLGATTRITGSITDRNRVAGVTYANLGYLTVEGCVVSGNGHDGILAGTRSTIQGNQLNNNGVNGILADAGSLVLDNVVYGHLGVGIGMTAVGSGGNVVNHTTGTGYTGVFRVHCDLDNATKACP